MKGIVILFVACLATGSMAMLDQSTKDMMNKFNLYSMCFGKEPAKQHYKSIMDACQYCMDVSTPSALFNEVILWIDALGHILNKNESDLFLIPLFSQLKGSHQIYLICRLIASLEMKSRSWRVSWATQPLPSSSWLPPIWGNFKQFFFSIIFTKL